MSLAFLRRGVPAIALAALVLASCATPEPEPVPEPAPAPAPVAPPPALALNSGIAQQASVYVAFMREVQQIRAPFQSAEAVQDAIRIGSSYESAQLSRSMIAYGAVLALQSPQFVQGVRSYAADPAGRQQMISRLIADPSYAAALPGADAAAGVITATIARDVAAVSALSAGVEEDAYTIQGRSDARRRWASVHIPNREVRLESAKTRSAQRRAPVEPDAEQLFHAAHAGSGWSQTTTGYARPPYTPAVARSLAIAALAVLGAGGEDARAYTDALTVESNNEFCLSMSKLMLFQCLAASRPSYEDIFCIGRHITRDLAACTAQGFAINAAAPVATVVPTGAPVQTPAPPPAVAPTATSGPRPYSASPN